MLVKSKISYDFATNSFLQRASFAGLNGGGGKRGRAKIHSPQPPFFLPARAFRIVCAARSAAPCQFLRISDKMSSSQIVKTHQNLTFGKLTDFFVGGTKCRPCVLPRQTLSARRGEPRLAVGQTQVRLQRDFNSVSDLLCSIIL